jgi:prepilin-type N-terminal cleavage/methylation domain-containing protein
MFSYKNSRGFTLIELLMVIAIIGLLSSIIMASLNDARKRALDARRLMDMRSIQTALELYKTTYGTYPPNTDNDTGGWDVGFNGGQGSGDTFISSLSSVGFDTPGDPNSTASSQGYRYYRYNAGGNGCDVSKGNYYVLGIRDMESTGNPHPTSPGFSCSGQDWQASFEWVTGRFENG